MKLSSEKPSFGDQLLVKFSTASDKPNQEMSQRRSWRNYSKEILINQLKETDWSVQGDTVQATLDILENKLNKTGMDWFQDCCKA